MLSVAAVLFLTAALGGILMALRILRGSNPPIALAIGHGLLAATALVLVLVTALAAGASMTLKYGLGVLLVAALGGFYLLSFHVRGKPHPKAVVIVHALVAVVGVGILLLVLLK